MSHIREYHWLDAGMVIGVGGNKEVDFSSRSSILPSVFVPLFVFALHNFLTSIASRSGEIINRDRILAQPDLQPHPQSHQPPQRQNDPTITH